MQRRSPPTTNSMKSTCRPSTPHDLAEHACLVVGTLDLWTFRGKGGELIEQRVTPSLRINDGGAVRDAACAGLGVALMATWCAADELRSGALVPALPEYPLVSTQPLWTLYRSDERRVGKECGSTGRIRG